MSKELTEQWRNGTLPCDSYYLKLISGATRADFFEGLKFCYFNSEDIEEVLAPVPTYDQFSQLVKKVEGLKQQLKEANKILFNV